MNTKKKHKNRPKPTPNQPQKVDSVVVDEKVEDVVKSEVKEDIPIVDEGKVDVETPVGENLDSGSETPKKPKRNKGKKKNQDKENEELCQDKVQDVQSEIITERVEEEIIDKEENKSTEAITPSARKKKNKKKPQEALGHQPNIPAKECVPTTLEVKEGDIQIDAEIKECTSKSEEMKPEAKAKKKNKKKKRNDSEKSDKSEEITCTSAFQQLLKDKPSEQKDVALITSPTATQSVIPMSMQECMISDDKLEENLALESIEKIKECKQSPEVKEETKSKKKNKKDKKRSTDEQLKEENPVELKKMAEHKSLMELIDPFMTQSVREPSPKPTIEAIPDVKPDTLLEILPSVKREPSPKPKAKIAKPVEKKKKGQQDLSTESLVKSTENLPIMIEEISEQDITQRKASPVPSKIDEIKIVREEQIKPESVVSLEHVPVTVDTINVPDQQKDKRRKKSKSPNPPKSAEKIQFLEEVPAAVDTIKVPDQEKDRRRKKSKSPKPPKSEEKIQFLEESQNIAQIKAEQVPCEQSTDDSKMGKSDSGTEIRLFSPKEAFIPLQMSEKVDEVPPLVQIDDMIVTKGKTEKKKKKTPKFPATTEGGTFEEAEAKQIKQLITPEATEFKDVPIPEEQKTERVSEPSAPEIEIQSTRTDESGSSCDATPVVQFLRSSSFQTLDKNNNNTVIHEVKNVEDLKQTGLTPLPIVERSGETPSKTPDIGVSDMRQKKSIGKEEPTYLKSKMMEVNQDMEGLRLSIERSLAEFSAMEKNEEEAEKVYEPHRLECEKTFENIEIATPEVKKPESQIIFPDDTEKKASEAISEAPPVCPARKDNKGKGKSKKKGKQEAAPVATPTSSAPQSVTAVSSVTKDTKEKQDKTEKKTESTDKDKQQSESAGKGKQQCDTVPDSNIESKSTDLPENSTDPLLSEQTFSDSLEQLDFAPIDNFEDALTSSVDDVNKTFEMIVDENAEESQKNLAATKPKINIIAPADESEKDRKRDDKVNPLSQPKNLLGHHDIPAQSNRIDYKKEKNKTPNERQAKVKIKDSSEVEAKKQSKESQTDAKKTKKPQEKSEKETFSRVKNDSEEYVYKYSFRKVFLQNACHVCHKELVQVRVPCGYCNLVFYCGAKHKDEDWTQHQALCFAVSTIAHLKDQKHIYADVRHITGQEYRLLRMQTIVSCEKVLKRRLVPWEQEAMLYPRICAEVRCREWRQNKLRDCEGCGQISYCTDNPTHLPKAHGRWCKSYRLYARLVGYQQTRGRLEPTLPTRGLSPPLAEKMNEVLAAMYEEKIDMNDIQYAALTQLATAPLTAASCHQLCKTKMSLSNGVHRRSSFTIHVVGAELQFEADALNKWEVFFLHLRPDVEELRVVLISPVLNPGELPLDLLGRIRLCDNCRQNRRRLVFSFQDKKNYFEYRSSEEFVSPDLVCAFNPSIQRSSVYSGKDPWPPAINCIIKQKIPFIITAHTLSELRKDIARIKDCSEADFRVISEPVFNNFASVRPDRNFISDDEMPLLFKNYCVSVLCGC